MESVKCDLSHFFEPRNIAIIGSFKEGFFGGYVVIKSLLNAGFKGQIYPINPMSKEIFGLKVYTSIKKVRTKIDLALIMINARSVYQVIKECAESGIRAIIVVSDGFAERDLEGVRLQNEIVELAKQWGIRIIGPNTVGIVNTTNGLNPCPYDAGYYKLMEGPIAICSQTGMTNPQAFPYPHMRLGVSKICDFGNKCDLNECDMLEYLGKDPKTKVISMYLESIQSGQKFLEISKRVTSQKPVLVLKSGRTQEGARVSASHTGSMAVYDPIFEATCNQAGILRLKEFGELFELPKIFASQPLPKGSKLGIISYTGAVGVLATDEGAKYGLSVTRLTPETTEMLDEIFPGLGKIPVDIGPMMPAVKDSSALYPKILSAVMADKNVDSLFNVIWVDPTGSNATTTIETYKVLKGRYRKPLATWIYGPNLRMVDDMMEHLEDLGFPVFNDLQTSIKALGLAFRYSQIKTGY